MTCTLFSILISFILEEVPQQVEDNEQEHVIIPDTYITSASSEKGVYGNLKKNCEVLFSFRLLWMYLLILR